MIRVSVIIPSFNSFATIARTIESLLQQSSLQNIVEIIIVDSGGREDIDAAEAFYDINNATAEWLFMPYSYNVAEGPAALKEVISRMKRLLSYEKLENQIEVLEDRQRKLNVVP